jgi:hypothetical protein
MEGSIKGKAYKSNGRRIPIAFGTGNHYQKEEAENAACHI